MVKLCLRQLQCNLAKVNELVFTVKLNNIFINHLRNQLMLSKDSAYVQHALGEMEDKKCVQNRDTLVDLSRRHLVRKL